jgi:hypothetical protein
MNLRSWCIWLVYYRNTMHGPMNVRPIVVFRQSRLTKSDVLYILTQSRTELFTGDTSNKVLHCYIWLRIRYIGKLL